MVTPSPAHQFPFSFWKLEQDFLLSLSTVESMTSAAIKGKNICYPADRKKLDAPICQRSSKTNLGKCETSDSSKPMAKKFKGTPSMRAY